MKPLVAYGSTMHQSEKIAKEIAAHFKVEAVELNKVTMDKLQETKFAIFVIATFGNGMFPQNSKQFAETLSYSSVNLSNLVFAELALGSNHYQFFCRAGEELNKMLTERGAKEIIPYVRSDKCEKDYGESVIENFKRDVTSLKDDGTGKPLPPKASKKESEDNSVVPLIAYGSTMGGSTKIAKQIASGYGTEAVELNSVDLSALEKINFAIYVVSTFGDGELPDNAIEFAERLRSSSVNLGSLQFALLGLGSTKYPKFCAAGNEIFDLLTNHGAKSVIPYVKSDKKSSDQGSSVIEKFVKDASSIKVSQSAPMNIYGDDLLIAYGSTMHSSEKIAKRIAEKFGIEAVELNSISINQLETAKVAIIVIATIGEGRFPKNSQDFVDRLTSSSVNLHNLRYALLGLGSTYYKDFCKAAINLNKLLSSHGASPVFQYLKSDKASPDQGRKVIEDFEKRALQLKSIVDDHSSVKPLVAYGSTRHKAEKIAKSIAEQYGSEAVELNNVTENDLASSKICIIVISTINDGDFPQNSRDFCQKLCSDSNVDLRGVQYALLGLGSSYYEKFCQASENLNKALLAHGAKPFAPYLKSDKATDDNGDGTINEFMNNVSKAMKSIQQPSSSSSKFELKEIGTLGKGSNTNEFIASEGFILVDIKSKELLSVQGYSPQLLRLTLSIPSSISYKAGDYCLIRPQNDPQYVSEVISALKLNPNTLLEITGSGINACLYPPKISVHQLFSQFIDLNARPSQDLRQLIGASNMANATTVHELIVNNLSKIPNLKDFLLSVTQIEPRTYSISSERKGELALIIGTVIIDDAHPGLCTHYLTLPSTKKLLIEVSNGIFKYPDDPSTPIIMCGLGTGISPLFSLIEHRENLIKSGKAKVGPCLVFIGTRYERGSKKALEMLQNYEKRKVITKFYAAISREGKKQHIQDKMKEVADDVWEVWKNEKAMIFFCGPPNTAIDDMRELLVNLAHRKENLTRTDAVSHCSSRKWCIEEF